MKRSRWTLMLCAIHCGVGLILGSIGCNRSTPKPDYSRTPVLFVHGHGLGSYTWAKMLAHFRSLGYPPEYLRAVEIVPNDMSNVTAATTVIAEGAEALLAAAAESARRAGHPYAASGRLDMIAHSMGPVSARWYAAKIRPDRVRTWISLAGANHGTNSLCAFSDDGSKEMCPAFSESFDDNFLQVSLNGTSLSPIDETPFGLGSDRDGIDSVAPDASRSILYLTVRIEPDEWIKPEQSAVLDGAGGVPVQVPEGVRVSETSPGNYLFLERVDHDPLLEHPQLIRLVEAMLSHSGDRETLE